MAPMKAMKGAAKGMTASAAYSAVADSTGLKAKDVKGVMEGIVAVAAGELKKNGAFKLAGALNLKLKKKPATPARKGQSIHEGTMPVQSQASVEDHQGIADEKAEGDDKLIWTIFNEVVSPISDRGGRTRQVCR